MGENHDVTAYNEQIRKDREAKQRAARLAHQTRKEAGEVTFELDSTQAECLSAVTNDPAEVNQVIGHAIIIARGIRAFKMLWNRG